MASRYGGEVEPELWSELSALGQATVSNGWRALLMPNGYPTYMLTEMRLMRPGDLWASFKSLVHEVPRELQEAITQPKVPAQLQFLLVHWEGCASLAFPIAHTALQL
jgi:hypothetical protein